MPATPTLPPLDLTPTEWAYMAGLIDGEGCVGLVSRTKKKRAYITPTLQIGNTNHDMIDWLTERFPGTVYTSPKDQRGGRKKHWLWRNAGEQTRHVLRGARPYMIVKAPQADIVLSLGSERELRQADDGKLRMMLTRRQLAENEAAFAKIRELNRRGVSPSDVLAA